MNSLPFRLSACARAAVLWFLATSLAPAVTYAPVSHSSLQAVTSNGDTAWPGAVPPYPIEVTGVVINNPLDMLDYSISADQPQWQVYIQTILPNDFGGTAIYMRKNVPWDATPDHSSPQNYTNVEWTAEMDRVNYPGDPTKSLPAIQYGDVITVRADAWGLFYKGKFNVNEQHNKSSANDFSITILQRGTTPTAASIALSDLKDSSNNFRFDATRETGCEHYQASLVHLENLLLDDPTDWGAGKTVTVRQGALTFPMLLGLDPALDSIDPYSLQSNPFNVTAILDQETAANSPPFTAGYRLWLTSASLLPVPEPGSLTLAAGLLVGAVLSAWMRKRR